jgi:conjugative transfer region protein (TIGR03748 family)
MNRNFIKSVFVLGVMLVSSVVFSREEVARTDRYTLVSMEARSDQAKPLSAITSVSLGRDVNSVGDAINELLKGSGYRWENRNTGDQLLDSLPLPAVVRNMGPIRLSEALQTLAGEAWILRMDNLNRVVWFEVNQSMVNDNKH